MFPFWIIKRKFWTWIFHPGISKLVENRGFCSHTIQNNHWLLIIHLGSQPNSPWMSAKPTQLHRLTLQINLSLLPTLGANKHHLTSYWFLWLISHLSPILRSLNGMYESRAVCAMINWVGCLSYCTLEHQITKTISCQPFTSDTRTIGSTHSWLGSSGRFHLNQKSPNYILHFLCVLPI